MDLDDSAVHRAGEPGNSVEAHRETHVETYFDAVPRTLGRAEEFGSLTLFVCGTEGGTWPHFARPSRGVPDGVTAADVARVRARQRQLGVAERFEWVAETTPTLRGAAEEAGLAVQEYPLMTLDPADATAPERPDGLRIRALSPGDPDLPGALAVPRLVFGAPAPDGTAEEEAALAAAIDGVREDGTLARSEDRIRAGLLRVVAAVTPDGEVVCSGQHLPAGDSSEIVGVATLPSARRRGIGLAVTAALVADAQARGVRNVVLSAADDGVARLYARLGFRWAGTVLIGEPPRREG
ncbi:GNAT family N-acetyltransferase [Streptomyces sp. NPDC057638]|uniref:GNAT family N-acetyltransferase n=1 Tax=Streptomyces sp. NPDC057638 TaxID=3346190 RepID=UPI0036B5472D